MARGKVERTHRVSAVGERNKHDVGRSLGREGEGPLYFGKIVGPDGYKLPATANVLFVVLARGM